MKLIPDLKQQIEVIISTTLDEYEITMHEWMQSIENLIDLAENIPQNIQMEAVKGELNSLEGSSLLSDVVSLHNGERIFSKSA